MCNGRIKVPANFYYGMIHLRALQRALNTQSLWFSGHTYCRVKALGITFYHMELVDYILGILDDIFYNMIIVQCAVVRLILSHHTWLYLKGCPICNGNVLMGIFKTNYWTSWQCWQKLGKCKTIPTLGRLAKK